MVDSALPVSMRAESVISGSLSYALTSEQEVPVGADNIIGSSPVYGCSFSTGMVDSAQPTSTRAESVISGGLRQLMWHIGGLSVPTLLSYFLL